LLLVRDAPNVGKRSETIKSLFRREGGGDRGIVQGAEGGKGAGPKTAGDRKKNLWLAA